MASSLQDVFEIPELLEMIIFQLPPRHIFVTQRVSKIWKAAIATSISIQRKLFRAPDEPPLTPVKEPRLQLRKHNNMHYQSRLVFNRLVPAFYHTRQGLFGFYNIQGVSWGFADMELLNRICQTPGEAATSRERRAWDDMFLTKPPCTTVMVYLDTCHFYTTCSIRIDSGIKLQHIFDIATEMSIEGAKHEKLRHLGIRLLML